VLRRLASLIAATTVAITAFAVVAPAAQASTEESQFVSLTNSARGSNGLHSYGVASDLVAVARRHSQEMAAKHTIYHNPNLASDVSGWQAVGENVGMGGSASSIHQAFMNSAPHRANILDRDFTQVGIGTAYDDKGVLYVTEVFRKPEGSTYTAPAPKPAPTTTTTRTRTSTRPVSTSVRRPATVRRTTAPKPVAKAVAKADPRAQLAARLAAARAKARATGVGALDHAVTYVDVMSALA
jgi:uncharacterized protein YkwD